MVDFESIARSTGYVTNSQAGEIHDLIQKALDNEKCSRCKYGNETGGLYWCNVGTSSTSSNPPDYRCDAFCINPYLKKKEEDSMYQEGEYYVLEDGKVILADQVSSNAITFKHDMGSQFAVVGFADVATKWKLKDCEDTDMIVYPNGDQGINMNSVAYLKANNLFPNLKGAIPYIGQEVENLYIVEKF